MSSRRVRYKEHLSKGKETQNINQLRSHFLGFLWILFSALSPIKDIVGNGQGREEEAGKRQESSFGGGGFEVNNEDESIAFPFPDGRPPLPLRSGRPAGRLPPTSPLLTRLPGQARPGLLRPDRVRPGATVVDEMSALTALS